MKRIVSWDLLTIRKAEYHQPYALKFTFSASTPKHKLCNNWPPLLRSRVRVRCAERTKRQKPRDNMRGRVMMVENEKEEDMEHWYWDLKMIHTQPLTVFASPQRDQSVLRNTGRGGTVSPCTSHYLECNENSSLKHITYINYSIDPEKYSAV